MIVIYEEKMKYINKITDNSKIEVNIYGTDR